jgi:hypothetical protein
VRVPRSATAVLVATVFAAGTVAGAAACTASGSGDGDGGPTIALSEDERWPARGDLRNDDAVRREVGRTVNRWRTPDHNRPDMATTKALFLGDVDGTAVAVVDVRLDGRGDLSGWLLEVTGKRGGMRVSQARAHPNSSPIVAEDVLPVRTPRIGPRYLVSARVTALSSSGGSTPVSKNRPLTDRFAVPECAVTEVVATRADADRTSYADLGTGDDGYPLLGERAGAGAARVLAGVDMCAAGRPGGWLQQVGDVLGSDAPAQLGAVTRIAAVNAAGLRGDVTSLEVWAGSGGKDPAVSVVYRPAGGAPVLSAPQRALAPIPQVFVLRTASGRSARPMAVVVWSAGPSVAPAFRITDVRLATPATTLVTRPGVLVALLPAQPVALTWRRGGLPRSIQVRA